MRIYSIMTDQQYGESIFNIYNLWCKVNMGMLSITASIQLSVNDRAEDGDEVRAAIAVACRGLLPAPLLGLISSYYNLTLEEWRRVCEREVKLKPKNYGTLAHVKSASPNWQEEEEKKGKRGRACKDACSCCFVCPVCPSKFMHKASMKSHVTKKHPKPEEADSKAEDGCKAEEAQGEQLARNEAEAKAGNAPEAEGADEFAAAEAAAENLICVPQIS